MTYTHFSENSFSVLNLTFTKPALLSFISNWFIDEEATTDSDHEVIQFTIVTGQVDLVESPINSSYNIAKAD